MDEISVSDSAGSFFYFTEDYYSKFKTKLKDNSCLGIVKKDGYVIAAAIFMYYSDYGHYHLAGSDKKYSSYGVNNFLLWNMVKTLKEKGIKRFHLGGGTNSDPDNSLFRFKESFSNNKANYYIGKLIFNEGKYKELCTVWEQNNPGKIGPYKNKLLKYRY
jgi:lipid II:glycine glycyltransferase (peptidoglycan interpeptide bridge formation enzyme)